jgi:fructosamine-3-kinase
MPLRHRLIRELEQFGDASAIKDCQPVGGGCIHSACRLETAHSFYMLKWNTDSLPGVFLCEEYGLRLLRTTGTVQVPQVFTAAECSGSQPAFILMEWIGPAAETMAGFDQEKLGQQLANLHLWEEATSHAGFYGLDQDNYIGEIVQFNQWKRNWIEFFRSSRLEPQIRLANVSKRLPTIRKKRLQYVVDHLDDWLEGVERRPSLLHGDLWSGNVIANTVGDPVVLDPAVYYGDREIDLAFTEMFGGFSNRFYEAYKEVWPLKSGYAERKQIYNLYHLINHLNHFGESYGPAIDQTLSRFVPTS